MKPFALAIIAVTLLASPAAAEHGRTAFKSFWDKLEHNNYAGFLPAHLAGVSRMALHAYDTCQAGDEHEAKALFERLALLHDERDKSAGPYNLTLRSRWLDAT